MANITVIEATYVDSAAGHNKFYRVFVIGPLWLTQYGPNGQVGSFTKIVDAGSPDRALAAAEKKFATKIKKGYLPHRRGTIAVEPVPDLSDPSWLDQIAFTVPVDAEQSATPTPITPITLRDSPAEDISTEVIESLHDLPNTPLVIGAVNDPVKPMLAESADPEKLDNLLGDPGWTLQYKYDGDRVVIIVDHGAITVLNRQGMAKTRGISAELLHPFTALGTGYWAFDGEIVDRQIVLFDMIEAQSLEGGTTWIDPQTPFADRYQVLTTIIDQLPRGTAEIQLAPLFAGVSKNDALRLARENHREGIMLRRDNAPYQPGRRSAHLLKHKFTHTADVVIDELATAKESASLFVFDPENDNDKITVGAASTIGKWPISAGEVWEVEFLYVIDPTHPRMVQPRLLRPRNDKAAHECHLDQFKHTGTNRSV